MRLYLTPWARGALTADQQRRLGFHDSRGLTLDVCSGSSKAWFTVAVSRQSVVLARKEAGREVLFERIVTMLSEVGEPLPTDEQWAELAGIFA